MDSFSDSRHVTRLEIVDTGRRRRWSDAQKQRIVAESFSAPRLASATARRYGISVQLLFAWRKAHRAGRPGAVPLCGFVPAMIAAVPAETGGAAACGRMEVVSANGRRVIVDGDVDIAALLRIIRGLETLR